MYMHEELIDRAAKIASANVDPEMLVMTASGVVVVVEGDPIARTLVEALNDGSAVVETADGERSEVQAGKWCDAHACNAIAFYLAGKGIPCDRSQGTRWAEYIVRVSSGA